MLQITPEITQDSLRSHTKDGGSFFKIKGKGLCCKFFFIILTHLVSVTNVDCALIPWTGSTQFCCFAPISFSISNFYVLHSGLSAGPGLRAIPFVPYNNL